MTTTKRLAITELRMEDDSTTNSEKLVLDAIEKYYKEMYTTESNIHANDLCDFIEHLEFPKLADEDRNRVEGKLTFLECKTVLDTFQADKTPVKTDLPLKFINIFSNYWGRT